MELHPVGNRVIIQKLESEATTKSGIFIPDEARVSSNRAKVVAVGRGKWMKTTGVIVPIDLKKGDIVTIKPSSATDVKIGDEWFSIVRADDIQLVEVN